MNTKKSILIYFDNYPMLISLPPEQRGWLLTALMVYGDRLSREGPVAMEEVLEQFPQLSPEARAVYGFMGGNIRRDTEHWMNRRQYRNQNSPVRERPGKGRFVPAPASEQTVEQDMERVRRLMEQFHREEA